MSDPNFWEYFCLRVNFLYTFATSNRFDFETAVKDRLKWIDKQYDMMASSVKPNAAKVNARYRYACNEWIIVCFD